MSGSVTRTVSVGSQSLDQYLHEISAYPLISRAEEAALARRIREGDDDALATLVRSNLRFVVSIAKRYQNRGVSLSDLINEGNIGLIRAAQKFDETRGTKFISYAVWWVRQSISQALTEQSRIVRIPVSRAGKLQQIGKRSSVLAQELGREPTPEEVAQELDLSREEIRSAQVIAQTYLSLDAPLAPGEDGKLLDRLADGVSPDPDADLYVQARARSIEEALDTLNERESEVLRLYFGLGDDEPLTLEQIGEHFGVTRERVRQIKERALGRLRHQSRARFLETYLQ